METVRLPDAKQTAKQPEPELEPEVETEQRHPSVLRKRNVTHEAAAYTTETHRLGWCLYHAAWASYHEKQRAELER